jgi:Hemerythrin HHE cation binding domain
VQQAKDSLFTCFREDHKVLGAGFHQLSAHLRAGDTAGACAAARHLDQAAGPHIAFEEMAFYPRLVPLFGYDEAERMRQEHQQGLAVIQALLRHPSAEPIHHDTCNGLLAQSEAMEAHIADCAELFEAIGRIPDEEQRLLHQKLLEWRQRQPTWTDFMAERHDTVAPSGNTP